jgi:hypothetical protein
MRVPSIAVTLRSEPLRASKGDGARGHPSRPGFAGRLRMTAEP